MNPGGTGPSISSNILSIRRILAILSFSRSILAWILRMKYPRKQWATSLTMFFNTSRIVYAKTGQTFLGWTAPMFTNIWSKIPSSSSAHSINSTSGRRTMMTSKATAKAMASFNFHSMISTKYSSFALWDDVRATVTACSYVAIIMHTMTSHTIMHTMMSQPTASV